MATVLIVEDSDTATVTLKAALKSEGHDVHAESTVQSGWRALQKRPFIDLLILDLSLGDENGFELLKRIRTDIIFEKLPVVIYTVNTNRDVVVNVLNCGIQNYLLKPAKPQQLQEEVLKAEQAQWRKHFFEEFKILSKEFHYNQSEYIVLLSDTKESLATCEQRMLSTLATGKARNCIAHLQKLKQSTPNSGCLILSNVIIDLSLIAREGNLPALEEGIQNLRILQKLVDEKIETLVSENKTSKTSEPTEDKPEPTEEILLEKIESLDNLPPFGNLAQAFRDVTQTMDIDVDRVVDLINKDPCLASQVISFANSSFVDAQAEIEDIATAVQLLGYRRVQFIALSITPPNRDKRVFTAFDWRSFWTNQVGCAKVCQKITEVLNTPPLPKAYLAGLLHGIGQIIISNYFPFQYKRAVEYAHEYKIELVEAEREFFGISHEIIGSKYANRHNFPVDLETAILHQHTPEKADRFKELAAVLNIAIFLCNKYSLGINGMPPISPYLVTLNKLPAWQIVKEWAKPQIVVENFEAHMEKSIRTIKADVENYADQVSHLELI